MTAPHLTYLGYVARHKYYVLRAGLVLGVPIRQLVVHDWSKFTPAEWLPYVRKFYGTAEQKADPEVKAAFRAAFRLHESRNPHHWQHWLRGSESPREMPLRYAREMVADWAGAGRAITGRWEIVEWYEANKAKIQLHPRTRRFVESLVTECERYS